MIVYGDRVEHARAADRLAAIADDLDAVAAMPPGIQRHAGLAGAFIALGQVVQGAADADFARLHADGGSTHERALISVLVDLAKALLCSWQRATGIGRGSDDGDVEARVSTGAIRVRAMLRDANAWDTVVELRLPEGYAFYALYPEGYADAARRLTLSGPPRVIGVRSIGTGLAALVAAVLEAPNPLTVRPTGYPFDRHIALAPEVEIDPGAHYVVVDEGPGLSGSSFAAVADLLEARGVPRARIAFLPSHAGEPGAQASERTRARWASAQRPVVTMDELIPSELLAAWVEPLVGSVDSLPEDISGGGWRHHVFADEARWPAANPWQERRKFLLPTISGQWLLKFAGLGSEGARKLARARLLHAAGLVPEVRGLVHGFLVQRWEEATPLSPGDPPPIENAARYLGARARLLPPAGGGASLAELFAMAQHNIGLALGAEAGRAFAERHHAHAALDPRVVRIATDNRCDPHEWLRLADGRLLKADALDHDAAHDMVGAQDLAWDVAGMAAEWRLDTGETDRLADLTAQAAGRPVDGDLLAFLAPCYLAFRLGAAQMAADSLGGWEAERRRNLTAVAAYRDRLSSLL